MSDYLLSGAGSYLTTPTTLLGSELTNLAPSNGNILAISAGSFGNPVGYLYADALFQGGAGFAPSANGYLQVWFLRSTDGGATFEDGSASVAPGRRPDLTIAIPAATGASGTTNFADEFASAGWLTHRTWQTGDLWAFVAAFATDGIAEGPTWWSNPIATPSASGCYALSSGKLNLGLIQNPGGNGISQATLGALINNLSAVGGLQRYGYHEFSVAVPAVPGFLFHWDCEDYPHSTAWTMELDVDIWTRSDNSQHVRFSDPINHVTFYETTSVDITQQHRYAVNWQADFITCYVDGMQVAKMANPGGDFRVEQGFSYFLTSDATYLAGETSAPNLASLPAIAAIDYYRVSPTMAAPAASGQTGFMLPPGAYKVLLRNQTGVSFPAGSVLSIASFSEVGPDPVPVAAESADGTILNATSGYITDGAGVAWTVVTSATQGLRLYHGAATHGANVAYALYAGHVVSYKDRSGAWFAWNGSAFVAATDPREAADGTTLSAIIGSFTDAAGTQWSLVQTAQGKAALHAGMVDGANLDHLLYHNHTVYRVDTANIWAAWSDAAAAWSPASDPANPAPDPPTGLAVVGSPTTTTVTLSFALATTGPQIDAGGVQTTMQAGGGTWALGPLVPIATPGHGTVTDAGGNVWSVGTDGKLYVGTTIQSETNSVILLTRVGPLIYQMNTGLNWYSKALPSDALWGVRGTTSPFSSPGVLVSGLSQNTDYNFEAYAKSSAGSGAPCALIPVHTPATSSLPGVPTLAPFITGSSYVTLSISPPAPGGGPLDAGAYILQRKPASGSGSSTWVAGASAPYCTPGVGTITDGAGVVWSITSEGKCSRSDTGVDQFTQRVVFAEIVDGTFWQKNVDGNWYNSIGPAGSWGGPQTADPLYSPSITVSGLTGNTAYNFRCYLTNQTGNGPYSNQVDLTTSGGVSTGIFQVRNGVLLGLDGSQFRARGLAIPYLNWPENTNVVMGEVLSSLAACTPLLSTFPGTNAVRFIAFQSVFQASLATLAAVRPYIDALLARNIIVLIDPHIYPAVLSGSDLDAVCNRMAEYAAHYKDEPRVWYQTQNEPNGVLDEEASRIYSAIRNAGASAPVIICCAGGALFSGYMNAATYAPMTNIMWDFHFYPGGRGGPSQAAMSDSLYQNGVAAASYLTSRDGVVPTMICEFGTAGYVSGLGAFGSDGRYYETNWEYLLPAVYHANFIQGYFQWMWNPPEMLGSIDQLLNPPYDGNVLNPNDGAYLQTALANRW